MSRREDWVTLSHIRDAAKETLEFSKNKTRADLEADRMFSLAVTHLLEIIGEASGRVTQEGRQKLPEIPWKDMIGMRNRIIHRYDDVNLNVVWQVIQEDLPVLLRTIESRLPEFMPPKDR